VAALQLNRRLQEMIIAGRIREMKRLKAHHKEMTRSDRVEGKGG
jgi:hypothetical protein